MFGFSALVGMAGNKTNTAGSISQKILQSILGILFLAATSGSELTIAAIGDDAQKAVDVLVKLVSSGFAD